MGAVRLINSSQEINEAYSAELGIQHSDFPQSHCERIVRGVKYAVLDDVCTDVRSLIENINPLYSDGFPHKDGYHKGGIVHYIFKGVTGRNFQIIIYSSPEDCIYLS